MAFKESLLSITREASADLSAHQFKLMQLDANGRVALAGATSEIIGILQNKPSALGRAAEIGVSGVSKCQVRSTVAPGALVTADANGLGTAAVASSIATPCIGRALETVSSTSAIVVPVLIDKETLIR